MAHALKVEFILRGAEFVKVAVEARKGVVDANRIGVLNGRLDLLADGRLRGGDTLVVLAPNGRGERGDLGELKGVARLAWNGHAVFED